MLWLIPFLAGIMCVTSSAPAMQAPAVGTIRGVIYDKEFDTPVEKVTIEALGIKLRVSSLTNGSYVIANLPAGTYTLVFTKEGYIREVKAKVLVTAGQLTDVDIKLAGEFEELDEYVVQDMEVEVEVAPEIAPMELAPLPDLNIEMQMRLESPQLLNSVGVEMITRSGASDAAAALLLVPGATLQNGKYAVIRGLPDRYVSTLLDGVRLPSADPDKRAVKLDQFPAAVIESIDVSKTFTPDQQGDSSGGAVNIILKDLPEEGFLQFKSQIGYNSQVKDGSFLTYPGGGLDMWGGNSTLSTHPELAGESWPNPTGTQNGSAPMIYKWSVSGGDSWEMDEGVKVGAFGNFFYDQDASFFDNGVQNSMIQPGQGMALVPEQFQGNGGVGDPFKTQLLDVTQGTESVQWGGMGILGLETDNHKLGAKFLYTLLSENQAVLAIDTRGKEFYFPGYDPSDPTSPGNDVGNLATAPYNRLETLDYSQMMTESYILNGEHRVDVMGNGDSWDSGAGLVGVPVLDWRLSYSKASENQPDQTQFGAIWTAPSEIVIPFIPPLVIPIPNQWAPYPPSENVNLGWVQHINYYNEETSTQGAINGKLPFAQWNDREGYLKAGVFIDSVSRSYTQATFSNSGGPFGQTTTYEAPFDQPWSAVFPEQVHPILPSTYDISYNGTQDINAYYLMTDLPVSDELNLITGLRFENTKMTTTVLPDIDATWIDIANNSQTPILFNPDDASLYNANIVDDRILPMIGLDWHIQEDLVLRAAFAQTLARANFYELVPVLQYDYLGGPIFIGNPGLQFSSLNNYDLRLDWTPFEKWMISGSLFYKQITDPIQYVQRFAAFEYTTAVNYPDAWLAGLEFETRVTLDPIFGEEYKGLALGANATFMNSSVTLSDYDQAQFLIYGVEQSTQPMTATPNYLVNLNATYEYEEWGTQCGIFYNLQGESMISGSSAYTVELTPAIYQLAYGTLNVTISQELIEGLRLSLAAKNLLNPEIQTQYRAPDSSSALQSSYTAGISLSVGLTYQIVF